MTSTEFTEKISLAVAKCLFRFSREEYYEDLAESLEDDAEPLSIVRKDASRAEERKDVMASLFNLWAKRMEDRSFVAAIGDTVPKLDQMILHSSDSANSLIKGLRFLSLAITASKKMTGAIVGALAMPAILFLAFAGMLTAFSYLLVPLLSKMLEPAKWPPLGKLVYQIATFTSHYGVWMLLVFIAAVSLMIWSFSRWTGRVRGWADRYLPPYMVYRDYTGSLFLVSLAALMENDVGLREALNTLSEHGNAWIKWHAEQIKERLYTEAENPGHAFDTGIFGRRLTDRVMDFGERSDFQAALSKVGLKSIDKSTVLVTRSAKGLNGVLIVFCGVFLMTMVTGTFMTISKIQVEKKNQMYQAR